MDEDGIKVLEEGGFVQALNGEVYKIALWYNRELGEIAGIISGGEEGGGGREDEVEARIENLCIFVGVNLTGVRKILKKYDKSVGREANSSKLSGRYFRMGVGQDAVR